MMWRLLTLALSVAPEALPWWHCDYAYASRVNGPITEASMNVQASTSAAAVDFIRRMVNARGYILEGAECKAR